VHILSFTSLYPNPQKPTFGIFVENRLRHLYASGQVHGGIIAPVPSFLGGSSHTIPSFEERNGLKVWHPPFLAPPKLGMITAPHALYQAGKKAITHYIKEHGKPDLLDIHYIYPDGVAGAWLAQYFNIPCVMTARGTDISVLPQYFLPRRLIKKALHQSNAIITVCEALRSAIHEDLRISLNKIHTLRNGVDLKRFHAVSSQERTALKELWGLQGRVLVSVGHLIERKGHHLIIEALKHLPEDVILAIAGSGEEESSLKSLITQLDLGHRVKLLGNLNPEKLVTLYQAADILVLASSREGWANVLLEAMACGTPVAATAIWGTPEIVTAAEAGVLIPERTPLSIAESVDTLLQSLPDRTQTRHYAEKFSWDETTTGQLNLFSSLMR
jgi:teichuronic acid biosynthesis glycosyltransferase TuaC